MGWKIWVLMGITLAYSFWYVFVGPYSELAGLAPGMPLEQRGFYTGADAVAVLSGLDDVGTRKKYISLLFDLPYMILWALLFEALIGFGIRRMKKTKPIWGLLFFLPIAFLLTDFAEDSFLALTLATNSQLLGSIAGIMTALKVFTYMAASLTALAMGIAGLYVWAFKRKNS